MEKAFFFVILLLSTCDGHAILNKVSVIPESSLQNVDRPEFFPLPDWPDSTFYEEDGPDIVLRCLLSPKTTRFQMKWYRNNMALHSGQNAYSAAGSVSYTQNIFIIPRSTLASPRIILVNPEDRIIHAELGSSLNISCTIDPGDISIGVVKNWQRDGGLINDSEHTTWGILSSDSTQEQLFYLTINSLNVKDYGEYECYTANELGNDTRRFQLLPPKQQNAERALPLWVYILIGTGGMAVIVVLATAVIIARRCRNQKKYEELEWQDPNMTEYAVPQHNVVYDVFISYSSEDLEWVKSYLFQELTEKKYHVCIDFKDFVPGMPISENIIDAIYKSKRTIILMSKNFLRSMWGQFELQQAHNRAIARREDVLILIKLDDCKIPAKMMGRTFLDWTNLDVRPHFWQRLAEAVGKPGDFGIKQEETDKFEVHDEQKEEQLDQIIDIILKETNKESLNHVVDS
ncbi:hypothetical protein CHS0354_037522 [Potamilus streckersoni]|uniref:Uncharacterized protein n=1 Tax=Potamilus streckersoni TaxID=2493646 RepID=A0AAE0VG78_9BIVA|nr:hypothetical protein CHS0354_037522 [Potamilus streckersoni]